MRSSLSFSALLAAGLLAACANTKTASSMSDAGAASARPPSTDVLQDPRVTLDPSKVVATVNNTPVTGAELDKAVGEELQKTTGDYVDKVHDIRKQGLEELVADRLLDMEAKSRGMTKEALIKQEVQEKAGKPSEAEIQAFYDRVVKGRYPVSLEDAHDQIAQQLTQDKVGERAKTYLNELKTKYKVTTSLPSPPIVRTNVAAVGPSQGPENAKVTIVEFSDFQCPYCGKAYATVNEVMKKYEGKVRLVFRNFPLPFHEHAEKAAEAGLCANEQGKFWPMYDKMFTNQDKLDVNDLKGYAKDLGLDTKKFDDCLDSGRMAEAVSKDKAAGEEAKVNGTPAFFINGRSLSGAQPVEAFSEIIDSELAGNTNK